MPNRYHRVLVVVAVGALAMATSACRADRARSGESSSAAVGSSLVALRGVRVVDGSGGPPIENATVVLEGERVREVGPNVTVPKGARVVDLGGTTMVPGLVSDHSHLGMVDGTRASVANETRANILRQLRQYEAYGVTTVTSLGLNGPVFYELQPDLHRGALPGADVFGADRGIGVPSGAPPVEAGTENLYRVETPEQAVAAVRDSATRHPDLVKIWVDDFHGSLHQKMSPEIQRAVIDEAHRLGLRVAAHVYYLDDARRLVQEGVDILAHGVRDRAVDDAFVKLLRDKKTWYIPTLGLDESFYLFAEAPPFTREMWVRHALQPALAAQFDDPAWRASVLADAKKLKADKDSVANNLANVKKLYDGGVAIGFGTDSGATPLRIPGFAELHEVALMVKAGLPPVQAIRIATSRAAELLGHPDRGMLAPGKLADFVIVEGDPTKDVDDLTRIVEVWHRGRKVSGALSSFQP
ncbi:amidohydrolase family protein [Labilithrix luteola]|nr:amidohydrolase family protein [Labilithrix luteola]